ncbi:MAG: transaldolase [Candidatus Doudnabacteria bacterium]|nr:transaldolase [Candidatus Doudnabacteria bacterium]
MKIYLDSANLEALKTYPVIEGVTTNPSIMVKAGIKDYSAFAKNILSVIGNMPISFEVFADEFAEMEKQAMVIKSWGGNAYVKIPIVNTKGESSLHLIRRLLDQGLKINITALLTEEHINKLCEILKPEDVVIVSIFAGRIADTGVDPVPTMKRAVEKYKNLLKAEILWASCREVLNVTQAREAGCHIITAPEDIIKKLSMSGKDLNEITLDTVKTFYKDATTAGFKL